MNAVFHHPAAAAYQNVPRTTGDKAQLRGRQAEKSLNFLIYLAGRFL